MTVRELYLNSLAFAPQKDSSSAAALKAPAKDGEFDRVLDKTSASDKSYKSDAKPGDDTAVRKARPKKQDEKPAKSVKEDDAPKTADTNVASKPEAVDSAPKNPEAAKTAEDKIVTDVAKELNISEEQVRAVLAALQISPLQLADDAAQVVKFVQALFGAEAPADLLTIDGAADALKAITGLMREFEALAKDVTMEEVPAEEAETVEAPELAAASEAPKEAAKPAVSQAAAQIVRPGDAKQNAAPAEQAPEAALPEEAEAPLRAVRQDEPNRNAGNHGEGNRDLNAGGQNKAPEIQVIVNNDELLNPLAAFLKTDGAAEASIKTEAVKNVNTADVINQIVEKMKVEIKSDVSSEIRISLKPEHLGDVSLKIATTNGIVTAQFVAESQRVKEIIEAGFDSLKDSLSEQGINISHLEVSVRQENSERMEHYNRQKTGANSRRINQIKQAAEAEAAAEINYVTEGAALGSTISLKA